MYLIRGKIKASDKELILTNRERNPDLVDKINKGFS